MDDVWDLAVVGAGPPGSAAALQRRAVRRMEVLPDHRGHTLYVLDEPTSGLHPADVALLLAQLHRLVDTGNTVVVVEHDTSVVATADHDIDLGPGGGNAGGRVLVAGTPDEVAACPDSRTGPCLARQLARRGTAA